MTDIFCFFTTFLEILFFFPRKKVPVAQKSGEKKSEIPEKKRKAARCPNFQKVENWNLVAEKKWNTCDLKVIQGVIYYLFDGHFRSYESYLVF